MAEEISKQHSVQAVLFVRFTRRKWKDVQVKFVTSTEVFKLRAEGKVSSDKAAVAVKHTGTVKEERVL